MLDVQSLQVFTSVAEKLSFTRAAEAMLLTQSAVSHQIAKMERELGVSLLTREGRTVSLTPAGRTLLEQSRGILRSLADLDSAVKTAAAPERARLRIGASATACQYLIPDTLREFRECFPQCSLSITPGDTHVVADSLNAGNIDLGILVITEGKPKYQQFDLFEDELGIAFNPMPPLAGVNKIPAEDLHDQRLVLYSRGSTTWRLVERHWARMRIPMNDPIELGSIEAIKELVKLGLGVSALARWVIRPQLADGSLVWRPLPGPRLKRRWIVAAQPHHTLNLAEKTFVELIRQCSPVEEDDAESSTAIVENKSNTQ